MGFCHALGSPDGSVVRSDARVSVVGRWPFGEVGVVGWRTMVWGGLALTAAGLPWVAWAKGPASLQPIIARAHPQVRWVDVPTLWSWMSEGRAVVVDVREADEYRVSHLPDAVWMKPGGELPEISPAPGQRIVVYCSVGWRSATAAKRLAAVHGAPVYNLTGGIFEWANQGRPLTNQDGPTHQVHPYDWAWGQWLEPEARAPQPLPRNTEP